MAPCQPFIPWNWSLNIPSPNPRVDFLPCSRGIQWIMSPSCGTCFRGKFWLSNTAKVGKLDHSFSIIFHGKCYELNTILIFISDLLLCHICLYSPWASIIDFFCVYLLLRQHIKNYHVSPHAQGENLPSQLIQACGSFELLTSKLDHAPISSMHFGQTQLK